MKLYRFAALFFMCTFSTAAFAQQTTKITPSNIGYLEYVPQDYNRNNNAYPLVIFLHGIGERGTTSTDPATIRNSVQRVAVNALPKYIKNGKQYPFIVISPQLKSSYGRWTADYVMDVLRHVRTYLRVDPNRIYITGLSLGGYGTWTTLAAHPDVFAAAVAVCSGGNHVNQACTIASHNVPVWAFHGTSDNVVSHNVTTRMINAINACRPAPNPLAKVTLFNGAGHNIWDRVYQQTDALEWMTSFTLNGSKTPTPEPEVNAPPVVNAGADRTIELPTNEVVLQASASDKDGSIARWRWTKVSGGTASLSGATSSRLRASNLVEGTYVFRVTVTDDKGATASDDVRVVVRRRTSTEPPSTETPSTNTPPVANAGPDIRTSATTVTLNGSGSDADGRIVSYRWTQYGGPSAVMTNANSPRVTISGLRDGKYYFRLTVTDDKGATAFDNMLIVVSNSRTQEQTSPTDGRRNTVTPTRRTRVEETPRRWRWFR